MTQEGGRQDFSFSFGKAQKKKGEGEEAALFCKKSLFAR